MCPEPHCGQEEKGFPSPKSHPTGSRGPPPPHQVAIGYYYKATELSSRLRSKDGVTGRAEEGFNSEWGGGTCLLVPVRRGGGTGSSGWLVPMCEVVTHDRVEGQGSCGMS